MPSVLISGANRGIGLEFARQYRADSWDVYATVRDVTLGGELRDMGARVLHFDAEDEGSAPRLAADLRGEALDVLIANAGISGDLTLPPQAIARAEVLQVMGVNTFGPLLLANAMLPNLQAGRMKIACAVSSLMSSITANDWGTQYVYRASKTALNAVWNALALEWRPLGISCVLIRPGLVKTRMTDFQGLNPSVSVAGMRDVVAGLTMRDSGRLVGYDGKDLPW